ncbi:MAG: hypothetical protein A2086_06535 [Spirochaetes bacterium GWD1_27_9]|nr:MAG: hypothetical protein A2086_06535 [Spirochaetes bacterium GWD1_27_9]
MNIKFRIWSFNLKGWINDLFLENLGFIYSQTLNSYLKNLQFNKSICIQQFTGLVDKNGKEIYEGDIVTTHHYDDWDDNEGFDVINMVKWCPIHVGWRGFTKEIEKKSYAGNKLSKPITIIGNIFENPQLCK